MSAERPPGWYADASTPGFERWWDGGTWSHVTRPVPLAASGQPFQPYQPYQQPYPGQQPFPGQPYPAASAGPYRQGALTVDGRPLAGQGQRLLARLLDWIVVGVASAGFGLGQLRTIVRVVDDWLNSFPQGQPPPSDAVQQLAQNATVTRAGFILSMIVLAVSGVYYILMTRLRGATLGKLAVGIKVTPPDRDALPSWRTAVLRWAATNLPVTLLSLAQAGFFYTLLDSLWCLWDGRRQCLHDKAAKTVVVRAR